MTKIAIIREEKIPIDTRSPLTPAQSRQILDAYPSVEIFCQSSNIRCYSDKEYLSQGIPVVDDVGHCDILLGVKEVRIESLIPDKTYLFFSHTIKKQPYNQKLLKSIAEKNIRLIDYECLTDDHGIRVIAFGRWAGIVGAYNAFWTYGKKYDAFSIKRAFQCRDLKELFGELKYVNLPPIKILITGNGRVSKGGLEVLDMAGIKRVDPEQYLFQQFNEPVYTQIDADVYTKRKDGARFSFEHFFENPGAYKSNFKTFYKTTDVLIMAAYWDPKAPRLFELEETKEEAFKIKVVADITCDIDGAVPTTTKPTSIDDPVYDLDLENLMEKEAFSNKRNLSVMAIDNLPNELPRDASRSFGEQMTAFVLPELLKSPARPLIKNATIVEHGDLTGKFEYLRDYLEDL
ncbi:MAG: NAD(P)-dependent oxidoreductase [Cytophagales bacterium]|nr:NAD(P)-dependent oxidoreductase [Cytophagales bacterium]